MKKIILSFLLAASTILANAQEPKYTRDQVLNMTVDELSDLPLEELMAAVEAVGVTSADELFAMIMNKNVSSASKKEEDSFKSPLSSSVLTKEEIRTYGCQTIEEAFRLIPGMIVTEKTNGVFDIQIRGLNNIPDNQMFLYTENSNTLLMIDGRIAHNYAIGSINFDMLPIGIEDIERIEVVRGANAALYGPNAVCGVINIITEKTNSNSKIISGNVQIGSLNTTIGDVAFRHNFSDKFSIGLTANYQYRERPTDELMVFSDESVALATTTVPNSNTIMSKSELDELYANGSLIPMSDCAMIDPNKIQDLRQVFTYGDGTYRLYNCIENETPVSEMFDDTQLARKSMGVNGYVTINPTTKIRMDLTGGYQQSLVNTTPVGDKFFSLTGRQSKTGYVNLNASIYGLRLIANYLGGTQNYEVGVPGFKEKTNNVNIGVEYDFVFDNLSIRPGITYTNIQFEDYTPDYINPNDPNDYSWENHDPGTYKYTEGTRHLSGYLNYDANISDIAPSLRVDYNLAGVRLIGAVRGDKTNIPDKWNLSYQASASYAIDENNFIRASFSTACRSAIMVNSSSNYVWKRSGMTPPGEIEFLADEDAELMKINTIELGYRLKPTKSVLIDAEFFYSKSKDYGELMANESMVTMNSDGLLGYMKSNVIPNVVNSVQNNIPLDFNAIKYSFMSMVDTKTTIKYGQLPYEVKQMGISMNVDWIISSKLIAKLNANIQQTKIDNYYPYSQTEEIMAQMGATVNHLNQAQDLLSDDLMPEIMGGLMSGKSLQEAEELVLNRATSASYDQVNTMAEVYVQNDQTAQAAMLDALKNGTYQCDLSAEQQHSVYYALKYNVRQNNNQFILSSSTRAPMTLENGHKHKATPSVYGMFGLIYKPIGTLSIATFANYIGQHEYCTKYETDKYGTCKLDNRFTVNMKVAYKPIVGFEIFFNAHNLFNTKAKEFVYCDEIGGLYTIGVNFGF